jgi:hypothetical protein
MVEVAGVEPASLAPSHTASTCLVAHLISLPDRRVTRYRFTSIQSDDTVLGWIPHENYACCRRLYPLAGIRVETMADLCSHR